jgi:hypothetical protein
LQQSTVRALVQQGQEEFPMEPESPLATELSSPEDGPQGAQPPLSEEPIPSAALPSAQAGWPDKPWLKIWTAPRGTIRAIVDSDPTRHVLLLAALGSFTQSLNWVSGNSLGDTVSTWLIIPLALAAGGVGAILSLYIGGALFQWTGRLFGGQASTVQVRAALAWSLLPRIAAIAVWITLWALYGEEMYTSYAPRIFSNPDPYIPLGVLDMALLVWSLFLMVKTVAEVHRFSAWRSLAALAIPLLVLLALFGGCAVAVMMAQGGM